MVDQARLTLRINQSDRPLAQTRIITPRDPDVMENMPASLNDLFDAGFSQSRP